MKKKTNVLIFPSGMENGIEIYNSLKDCKDINIFSATENIPNQTFFLYKNVNLVSNIKTPNWIKELNNIIENNNIDLIYPANSMVIDALSQNKEKINTDILLPDEDILKITRSKKATISFFENDIPCPKIYNNIEDVKSFPVFAKLDNGYGAIGAQIINNEEELKSIDFSTFVIQEYLPFEEYTVDCLSDKDGNVIFYSGRERSRIRMATSMHAKNVTKDLDSIFFKYAKIIASKLKISGAWFFQVKKDINNVLKLMEIDIRIAGTMCFDRCKGINFPLLSIYLHQNKNFDIMTNNVEIELDRCLKNRYSFNYEYNTVYIDLDDTIICKNKINTDIIKFIYQCINNNKKIILLSKNLEKDKYGYLKKFKIHDIFDEIHWLEEEERKANYITEKKAIFIDDSFSQRKDVAQTCNIPTFDLSMIEVLIDDRI